MKKSTRRQVLKGLGGATLALPALDIFEGRAKAEDPPTYAVFVVASNGVVQDLGSEPELFWPSRPGPLSRAALEAEQGTRATAMLARHADKLLVVRGVNHAFESRNTCGHTWGNNQCLTAQPGSEDLDGPATSLAMGESIDYRIAREKTVSGRGPLTLHAGLNAAGGDGYGNPGYVSYKGPKQPMSPDSSPWAAYLRLSGLSNADPTLAKMVVTRRKSVNDFVRSQIKTLESRKDLSAEDRRRLDAHLSAVRDLELGMATTLSPATAKEMEALDGKDVMMRVKVNLSENREAVIRLHMELIAFAFAGDLFRSATLKIGDNNDGWQAVIDGVQQPSFHMISHGVLADGGDGPVIENAVQMHAKIVRIFMSQFGILADRLAAVSSPSGSLLDRGYCVFANQVSNGNHDLRNMPYVIVGKANGRLKTGRFVDLGGVPHNLMLNALLAAAGVTKPGGAPVDDFGAVSLKKGILTDLLT
ncbi:MAG: DUF1552 domain-containing protein [Deltaproteobacteria bacterium]|nr:DUF1552 domain-containing protein [Deltaproteobacteria bacterium]